MHQPQRAYARAAYAVTAARAVQDGPSDPRARRRVAVGATAAKSQRVLRVKSGTAMRDNELRFVASSFIP